MQTNTEPVQLDAFPKEWSADAANRVLDAAVQRVLRSTRAASDNASTPRPPAPPDDCCMVAWAFGPGGGRA